ncbi:MAG: amino acid ABC transporter permease [Thermoplasmatota archaeon]
MVIDGLINALPQLMDGLVVTILLTFFSLILATVLGIVLAVGRSYGGRIISFVVYLYEKIFRGIPLLVLFFLIYFGLTQVGINLDPFPAAILGLALRSAAYQSQIFRGAINSIPHGQTMAAYSLGMSRFQTIREIILPQVLRLSIPGWSNELTIVLKDTSIAFSIGVVELMRQGRYIYSLDFNMVLPILLLIAVIYFVIVFSINKGLGYLEKKYKILGLSI